MSRLNVDRRYGCAKTLAMRSLRYLCVGLFALVLGTCASGGSTIESNKDPDFHGALTKLYVAVGHAELNEEYGTHLAEKIAEFLSVHGVTTQYVVFAQEQNDDLRLSALPIDTAVIKEFDPDGVLLVREVASVKPRSAFGHQLSELSHDASLFVDSWVTRVWRAKVDTYGSQAYVEIISKGYLTDAARAIVSQMQTDGLIAKAVSDR